MFKHVISFIMKRKEFITKSILGTVATVTIGKLVAHTSTSSDNIHVEGYNHLPNKEIQTMNSVLHLANSRGQANHGWLQSFHSFSFANYHNSQRMNFGVLRVLNDDTVAPGMGFGTHPHNNMEIISIPLSGDLEHQDSMGNKGVIKSGDVQVMSAGTGIQHSEYNKNKDKEVKFLQIWVIPNKKEVTPRYDQISIQETFLKNSFNQILSPNANDPGVWIHQDAWFHLGEFEQEKKSKYQIKKPGNGVYIFVISGEAQVENQPLSTRDGFGIWDVNEIQITTKANSKILLMEVPMHL